MNSLDLSGKILFKVKLDNEIKKLIIHNDDLNYNELLLMMQRIFSDKIKQNDEFTIKYTDEENDLITIANDSDVTLALQASKILKLTILLKDKDETHENVKPAEIVKELQNIRQSIDRFLEKFEKSIKLEQNIQKLEDLVKTTNDVKLNNSSSSSMINNEAHKEFDPLNKKLELNDTHGHKIQKNSRAQTPDSIGSSEFVNRSSPGHKTHQQFVQTPSHTQLQHQQQQQTANFQQESMQQNFNQQYNPHAQQPQQQQLQQQTPQLQQNALPHPMQSHSQQNFGAPNQFLQNASQSIKPTTQSQPQQPAFLPNALPNNQTLQQPTNPVVDPQQQQYYQASYYQQQNISAQQHPNLQHPSMISQQPQHPNMLSGQQVQQAPIQQQSTPGYPPIQQPLGSNPYSKNPNVSLARPPSTTIYQQGYK